MGRPKAALEWHGSTLLRHTVGVLGRVVAGPVLVVRAPGQVLPALPEDVHIVDDPVEGLGPLQGIAVGLATLFGRAEVAFVAATDQPLLHPAFVSRVLTAHVAGDDVVLPQARGHPQPLAAAYRVELAPLVTELVSAGQLRPGYLFEQVRTRHLDEAALLADPALAAADPELDSLLNVNDPGGYAAARARPAPRIMVCGGGEARRMRAATLAAVTGRTAHGGVRLNGQPVRGDPDTPLVTGDVLELDAPEVTAGRST